MLRDRTLSDRTLAVCCCKSQYMYKYIIETETPLSELKIFLTTKKLEPSARLSYTMHCDYFSAMIQGNSPKFKVILKVVKVNLLLVTLG